MIEFAAPFFQKGAFNIAGSKSKYNVDTKDKEKRTHNGIVFDSVLEKRYFTDVVLPGVESGEIVKYELQKSFLLQPYFKHNEKTVLCIKYVADFVLEYADGRIVVIDTKGKPDPIAKMKRKMFWFNYPDIEEYWMSFTQKTGWVTFEELTAIRKENRRLKAKAEKESALKEK